MEQFFNTILLAAIITGSICILFICGSALNRYFGRKKFADKFKTNVSNSIETALPPKPIPPPPKYKTRMLDDSDLYRYPLLSNDDKLSHAIDSIHYELIVHFYDGKILNSGIAFVGKDLALKATRENLDLGYFDIKSNTHYSKYTIDRIELTEVTHEPRN